MWNQQKDRRTFLGMSTFLLAGGVSGCSPVSIFLQEDVARNVNSQGNNAVSRLAGYPIPRQKPASLAPSLQRHVVAKERSLSLYNQNTGENFKGVFWEDGDYNPDAMTEISRLLRDHRTDEVRAVDEELMSYMHRLSQALHNNNTIDVLCGYRSPKTNAMLAARGHRVARNSYHLRARAVDFRFAKKDFHYVRKVALSLHNGGVGIYRRSGFLHIDTGPVRSWTV